MRPSPLARYIQLRAPLFLSVREWQLANSFAARVYHLVVWSGGALWLAGFTRNVPYLTGAGVALVLMGCVMKMLAVRLRRTTEPRSQMPVQMDAAVLDLLVRLADTGSLLGRFWQRLLAPPLGPQQIDRVLRPQSREWLENGAANTLRVLGTLERLGPENPLVRRMRGELEWAVDHGMMQLFRYAVQIERYPETSPVVAPDAHKTIHRLERLADLVEQAALPTRDMESETKDPLQRAVEDLSLETLVRAEL